MYVYYCRTYVKAVRGEGGEEGGRVLWDATSRGLCGRVGSPRTNVRAAWANCESEACEDRDGRAGGATMLQPVILKFTLKPLSAQRAGPPFEPLPFIKLDQTRGRSSERTRSGCVALTRNKKTITFYNTTNFGMSNVSLGEDRSHELISF